MRSLLIQEKTRRPLEWTLAGFLPRRTAFEWMIRMGARMRERKEKSEIACQFGGA